MTTPAFASPLAFARFRHLKPYLEDEVPIARLAKSAGIGERTLRRWLARYLADGIDGLERRPRADKGCRRAISPELEALVREQAAKRPRPPLTAIHRRISAMIRQQGLSPPSYAVVADIARALDPALIAACSSNPSTYRDAYELVHHAKPKRRMQCGRPIIRSSTSSCLMSRERRASPG